MKTTFLQVIAFILLCHAWQATAQNLDLAASNEPRNTVAAKPLTRNAGFPGLGKFLSDSLRYPELARKNCVEGVVTVDALIGTDGAVSQAKLVEKLGYGCDEAVLDLILKMPKWEPALVNGQPIEQKVRIPVRYKMQ